MLRVVHYLLFAASLATSALVDAAAPAAPDIRMATTTSTENSGLLAVILPQFEARYGGKVRVVAVGSGGVKNAAFLAIRMLALKNPKLEKALLVYKEKNREKILKKKVTL